MMSDINPHLGPSRAPDEDVTGVSGSHLTTEEHVRRKAHGATGLYLGPVLDESDNDVRLAVATHDGNYAGFQRADAEWNAARLDHGFAQSQDVANGVRPTAEMEERRVARVSETKSVRDGYQGRMAASAPNVNTARGYNESLIEYLAAHPDWEAVFKYHAPPKVNGDPRHAEAGARLEQKKVTDEIAKVRDLPLPKGDVLAVTIGNLDKDRGGVGGLVLAHADGRLSWAMRAVGATGRTSVDAIPDPLALHLSVPANYEAAKQSIVHQIDRMYEGITDTASPDEKRKRIARLNAKMLDAQRLEVAAVRARRAAGDYAPFRPGLDIRAIANLDGPPPAKRRR